MLTQLNIQGLAIIDTLSIEFSHGFNVITGETGAGKSILIKALGLLLGAKASAETVRRGREQASVTGLFEAPKTHRCLAVLEQYGIPAEAEGDHFGILVRRTVNQKGRSLAWINDVPVTAQVLKELAVTLIDVFGQHENLRLLDSSQHTSYVDQFLKDKSLLPTYLGEYAACQEILRDLAAMVDDFRAKRRDADYLTFRCEELKKFGATKDDYDQIFALCQRGGHQMTLVSGLEQAQACLDQGAGGEALGKPLWEAGKILSRLEATLPDLKELADEATALASRIDDLSFQVGKSLSRMEVDEGDLEAAQGRLAGYQDFFRKLAVHDIDGLLIEQDRLLGELTFLESAAVEVNARLKALGDRVGLLRTLAEKLSKARHKAKDVVKQRIEGELHELAMPGATIDIEFSDQVRTLPVFDVGLFGPDAEALWVEVADVLSGLGEHGAEKAQFLLSPNPGEALLPLQKIASGGEISRVMLALKKALAAGADTCILVFDEIDTGISGRVADVVGRKMQELASDFQVICISHLAQVAAFADTHFLVHKFGKDKRTESTISQLSTKDSEEEIARLLSGDEMTSIFARQRQGTHEEGQGSGPGREGQALISPTAALDVVQTGVAALIDVRSEGEFAQGQVPGFANAPILTNEERHQVGLTYKTEGQAAAIAVGHRLVDPVTRERVAAWMRLAESGDGQTVVTCWRGGLRSQLACEQMEIAGRRALRVEGGYKAMRNVLLGALTAPPPLLVVGGLTGSGKTRLISALPLTEKLDLEAIAMHRGSAFGGQFLPTQPSQATFENAAALVLRLARRPVVLEDESAAIGQLRLPKPLYDKMQAAPVVWLETSLEERIRSIHADYMIAPLAAGVSLETLAKTLESGIKRLVRRLGGALTQSLALGVTSALTSGKTDLGTHAPWIQTLLTEYYDKSYHYAFARLKRQVLFRGAFEECRQWILHRYA